jgi:squalene-associated FAD-dependent desaturase
LQARRLGVVGAGWAGIAAAVRATQAGWQVTIWEMAPHAGGRARSVLREGLPRDNGQHILIGAYARTLDLMAAVGVNTATALSRLPLRLQDMAGDGLALPAGHPMLSFARAVLSHPSWEWRDKRALLVQAARWMAAGFRCDPDLSVRDACHGLTQRIMAQLIDPMCVAALNTPSDAASHAVFLRVLRDALFGAAGSADLLLPRRPLSDLLPTPALEWLAQHGARVHMAHRVKALERLPSSDQATQGDSAPAWSVDGETCDAVVLAATASESARLAQTWAPEWAREAAAFAYEPIATAWVRAPGHRLPAPMVTLYDGPAQFAFDLGALWPATEGMLTLVVSGAGAWRDAGTQALRAALQDQLHREVRIHAPIESMVVERRATFRCTPGLKRPSAQVLPGLWAAGDYVEGPYPATLEGAVRSGEAVVQRIGPPANHPAHPPQTVNERRTGA